MTERERFEKVFPSPKVAEDAYQALQDELIQIQATIESFATPAAALSALIDWHVAVATDPRVNGGKVLVPVEATQEMIEAADKVDFTNEDTEASIINMWQAMLAAA